MTRLDVRKTHKLYIGGAFPRSESGRTFEAVDAKGGFLGNMALASRKDARDAVLAARKAFGGWSTRTPYNRGQVIYRLAEVMEGRRDQFIEQLRAAEGLNDKKATTYVDAAIDRVVWYAGWADKFVQALGNGNPVSGPFFNLSTPEPTGVVATVAPSGPLLGPRLGHRTGDRHRQHRRRGRQREVPRAGRDALGVHGDLRPARRRRQHPDRQARRDRARGWRRTWTSTRSTWPASTTPTSPPRSRSRRPRTSSASSGPPRRRSTGSPSRRWARLEAFVETKTVWHPIGV